MGRPLKALPPDGDAELCKLAAWLRESQAVSGCTLTQLAQRIGQDDQVRRGGSVPNLSRVISGRKLPSLAMIEAFARAAGADPVRTRRLWAHASRTRKPRPDGVLPARPETFRTTQDLTDAMALLHWQAGAIAPRELDRRTGPGRLPRTTLTQILAGNAFPSRRLLQAFLDQCDLPPKTVQRWLDAHHQLLQGDPKRQLREQRNLERAQARARQPRYLCEAAEAAIEHEQLKQEGDLRFPWGKHPDDLDEAAIAYANDKANRWW